MLGCLYTEIDPESHGVHGQRWPTVVWSGRLTKKTYTKVLFIYVCLDLIANKTVKLFPFFVMHITKNTFLPRIIEVQALSEIISNYSAFGIN